MDSQTAETILVVDDESMMVNLCKNILGMGGYTVLGASGGEDALHVLQNASSEVHLALLDIVMPGLNGIELAKRIQGARPATKVVLMSGYAPADVAKIAGEESALPVIWKPFRAESLLRMIENVLKGPPAELEPTT